MTNPTYSKGIRVEMPQPYLQVVGSIFPDFKFSSRAHPCKTKTFCFCGGPNGGRIKFTNYQDQFEQEIVTLDGHETLERPQRGRILAANFGLLCQEERLMESVGESRKFAEDVLRPYLAISNGRPIVQSMRDFRAKHSPTGSWDQLSDAMPFQPSVADLRLAPVHRLFSDQQHKSLISTFDTIMHPMFETAGLEFDVGRIDQSVLVVGLELEFMWSAIEINADCETSQRGLFVAGDTAGLAQGVIQAAMMGIRVADIISQRISAGTNKL
ncbi:hypothetical protein ACIHDR_03570 [Nocardia sp. NPDC052278]|uniref:hypothetical protein n=1 Tax=unclassified Nocardia TaxID=2637762 RepID=UPI0036CC3F41